MKSIDEQIKELQVEKAKIENENLEKQKEELKIWADSLIGKCFRTKFYGNYNNGSFDMGKITSYDFIKENNKYFVVLKGKILYISLNYLLVNEVYKGSEGGSKIMATIEKIKKNNKTANFSSIQTYSFCLSNSVLNSIFTKFYSPSNIPNELIPMSDEEYNDAKEFAEYIDHLILHKFKYVLNKSVYVFPEDAIKETPVTIDIPIIKLTTREVYLLGNSIKSFLNCYNELFLTKESMKVLESAVRKVIIKYNDTLKIFMTSGERYRSSENTEAQNVLKKATEIYSNSLK